MQIAVYVEFEDPSQIMEDTIVEKAAPDGDVSQCGCAKQAAVLLVVRQVRALRTAQAQVVVVGIGVGFGCAAPAISTLDRARGDVDGQRQ